MITGAEVERPHLTKSMLRTLRLAFSGRTSQEIAAELGLKTRTIESQLYLAYLALGVHNRAQAYRKALALGLIARLPGVDDSDPDAELKGAHHVRNNG